ncbi:MAG: N-methyl-L-tryptophan oxidase [Burkholderiales bacterium]
MIYDAIVIGLGGMGSAALFHLARRSANVLGLEQFDIAHDRGSSHGRSRIIRLAYAEHPGYVPLLRRAYALWYELETVSRERLLIVTGGIDAGLEQSATIQGSLASCAIHDLPHELMDAHALAQRFPGYHLAQDMVAVYQPDAGFLLPERCVAAHVTGAQASGAEVHVGEKVAAWHAEPGGAVVTTQHGRYHARKLVVTAGPWARTLVPALERLAVPERQVMLWTTPRSPALFEIGCFPVFNMEAPEGRFYGFPAHETPAFKIGKYHHRGERVGDPDTMDRACHAEDEAVLREGVRRYFPDADGATLEMKACLFTNSPDEHFIIDVLPDAPQVAVAAGFSGHGFKFCSVVGEVLADLTLDGRSRHNTALFHLGRPALHAELSS